MVWQNRLTLPPLQGEKVTERLVLGDLAILAGVFFLFPFGVFLNGFTIAILFVKFLNGVVLPFGVEDAERLCRTFLPLEPLLPTLECRFLPITCNTVNV